jgi:hypothetical protein
MKGLLNDPKRFPAGLVPPNCMFVESFLYGAASPVPTGATCFRVSKNCESFISKAFISSLRSFENPM